jgi:hypothetical protein
VQRRLFIEDHKQMHREGNSRYGGDRNWVGVSEDHPKSDPTSCESNSGGFRRWACDTIIGKGLAASAVGTE